MKELDQISPLRSPDPNREKSNQNDGNWWWHSGTTISLQCK